MPDKSRTIEQVAELRVLSRVHIIEKDVVGTVIRLAPDVLDGPEYQVDWREGPALCTGWFNENQLGPAEME